MPLLLNTQSVVFNTKHYTWLFTPDFSCISLHSIMWHKPVDGMAVPNNFWPLPGVNRMAQVQYLYPFFYYMN